MSDGKSRHGNRKADVPEPPELTAAAQAWMIELHRIGTEEGLPGYPMHPQVVHGLNDMLEYFEVGLTFRNQEMKYGARGLFAAWRAEQI
jgi:hypothetical protein